MTEHNIGNIVWLNLDEVDLFGWEEGKSVKAIARMVRKIEADKELPPVFVAVVEGKYVLSACPEFRYREPENYGGHHRALAHYISKIPLKCQITEDYRNERIKSMENSIKNLLLVEGRK